MPPCRPEGRRLYLALYLAYFKEILRSYRTTVGRPEVSGRPSGAEARLQLENREPVCRSAPRPILQRRGRIGGPCEPACTSQTGESPGSGSRDLSLPQEAEMNQSETAFVPCGIEVSSRTLVVAIAGKALVEFPNTPAGHHSLIRRLIHSGQEVRICMEATGLYGLDLALALHADKIPFMIANPRSVRNFARAMMQRSKTDQLDAEVLREYAARMPFQPWQPPSLQALQLMAVTHRMQALTRMLAAEKNWLHAASLSRALPAGIRQDLVRSIQNIQKAGGEQDRQRPSPTRPVYAGLGGLAT